MKKVLLLFALILGSSALISCKKPSEIHQEDLSSSQEESADAENPYAWVTYACTNQAGDSRYYTLVTPARYGRACELVDVNGVALWHSPDDANYCESKVPELLSGLETQGFSCQ